MLNDVHEKKAPHHTDLKANMHVVFIKIFY